MKNIVHCPTCHKTVPFTKDNPYLPFCSERCKLIDLGEWAHENYSIPDTDSQLSESDIQTIAAATKH